nr:MAG TPA: hypothetical protein [Microviridae sp.]
MDCNTRIHLMHKKDCLRSGSVDNGYTENKFPLYFCS